jgi:hypothetical protein
VADFRLVERDGEDVLHRWPAYEECNLDDSAVDYRVSEEAADYLVAHGTVRRCKHCFPDGD